MTATFARIQQNADMEWKFIRAATWIHYFEDRYDETLTNTKYHIPSYDAHRHTIR